MEFVLTHPDDPSQTARIGSDPARGMYVEVTWNNVLVTLDQAEIDPDRDPVVEVVVFLAGFGFVAPGALADVRAYLDTPSCWRAARAPGRVRRVLAIVEELEAL